MTIRYTKNKIYFFAFALLLCTPIAYAPQSKASKKRHQDKLAQESFQRTQQEIQRIGQYQPLDIQEKAFQLQVKNFLFQTLQQKNHETFSADHSFVMELIEKLPKDTECLKIFMNGLKREPHNHNRLQLCASFSHHALKDIHEQNDTLIDRLPNDV